MTRARRGLRPFGGGPSRFIASAGVSTPLVGRGTATISLVPGTEPEFPPYWAVDPLRYDFAPIPEPATLLLLDSGLVAVYRTRRRQ